MHIRSGRNAIFRDPISKRSWLQVNNTFFFCSRPVVARLLPSTRGTSIATTLWQKRPGLPLRRRACHHLHHLHTAVARPIWFKSVQVRYSLRRMELRGGIFVSTIPHKLDFADTLSYTANLEGVLHEGLWFFLGRWIHTDAPTAG